MQEPEAFSTRRTLPRPSAFPWRPSASGLSCRLRRSWRRERGRWRFRSGCRTGSPVKIHGVILLELDRVPDLACRPRLEEKLDTRYNLGSIFLQSPWAFLAHSTGLERMLDKLCLSKTRRIWRAWYARVFFFNYPALAWAWCKIHEKAQSQKKKFVPVPPLHRINKRWPLELAP